MQNLVILKSRLFNCYCVSVKWLGKIESLKVNCDTIDIIGTLVPLHKKSKMEFNPHPIKGGGIALTHFVMNS